MKKSDTIEENVQSLFELGQQAFSEIVMFMDMGDYFMKARLKDHDFSTKVFQINAKNINEEMIDSTDKFKDCFEKVDRPICDEEGRICEKIKFGESGFFYLDIQDGHCLKNIDTHSMNSFFINYNKELNQYCFFKFSNEDHLIVSADYHKAQKGENPEDFLPVYDKETEEHCWGAFELALTGIEYDKIDDPKYEKELNQKLDHIYSLLKHGYKEPESLPLITSFAQNEKRHAFNLISSLDNFREYIYENLIEFTEPIIDLILEKKSNHNYKENNTTESLESIRDLIKIEKDWPQVTIELVSNDSILVKAPDFKTKRFNYTDLGMRDDRRGDMPNQLWDMVKRLAVNNGEISVDEISFEERRKIEKTIQRMRTHFKTVFGIEGMPINRYSKKHGYVTQFNIKDCRPTSYNQPFLE